MSGSAPYADSSFDFSMSSYIKNDTIHFGSSRVFFRAFTYTGHHGDTLAARILYPGGQRVDSSKLLLLLPGFRDQPVELYPLAIEATKRGIISMIFCPRGVDLNDGIATDYGVYSIADAQALLRAYRQRYSLHEARISVFGASLGSVAALYLAINDQMITSAVLESIMPDISSTAKKILSGSEEQQVQELLEREDMRFENYNPERIIRDFPSQKRLLVIWGENDKLISAEDRNKLRELIGNYIPSAEFEVMPEAGHLLRFGFPLSQREATRLNQKIVSFLQ